MNRTKTLKVKLDGDLYHDWGAVLKCCGKTKWFNKDDFESGNMFKCNDCGRLLIVVCHDGIPYYVGNQVFDRVRK